MAAGPSNTQTNKIQQEENAKKKIPKIKLLHPTQERGVSAD